MAEHKNTQHDQAASHAAKTTPPKDPAKDDAPPGHTKEEEDAVEKTLADEHREKPVPNAFNPAGEPQKDQQAAPDTDAKALAEAVQAANQKVLDLQKQLEEARQELWEAAEKQRLAVSNLATVKPGDKGAPEKSAATPKATAKPDEPEEDHPAAKSHATPKK